MDTVANLKCHACGYALRGLPRSGNCPECGESIRRSAAKARLRRLKRWPRIDGIVIALVFAYAIANFVVVHLMMEADPFLIFEYWRGLVFLGPGIVVGAVTLDWLITRRFRWYTLLLFILGMTFIACVNFAILAACIAAV